MWDFSSPTGARTHAPRNRSTKILTTGPPREIPLHLHFKFLAFSSIYSKTHSFWFLFNLEVQGQMFPGMLSLCHVQTYRVKRTTLFERWRKCRVTDECTNSLVPRRVNQRTSVYGNFRLSFCLIGSWGKWLESFPTKLGGLFCDSSDFKCGKQGT